jgi:hypothetical protein
MEWMIHFVISGVGFLISLVQVIGVHPPAPVVPVVTSAAADEQTVIGTWNGTWNGTWEGQYGRGRMVLVLVQNASELTGTVAITGATLFSPEPQTIREGRISDRAVTFRVDGLAGRIDATATVKGKGDASGTFTFRGAPYHFSVAR